MAQAEVVQDGRQGEAAEVMRRLGLDVVSGLRAGAGGGQEMDERDL